MLPPKGLSQIADAARSTAASRPMFCSPVTIGMGAGNLPFGCGYIRSVPQTSISGIFESAVMTRSTIASCSAVGSQPLTASMILSIPTLQAAGADGGARRAVVHQRHRLNVLLDSVT